MGEKMGDEKGEKPRLYKNQKVTLIAITTINQLRGVQKIVLPKTLEFSKQWTVGYIYFFLTL